MNSTPPGTCSSIVSKAVRSRDTYSSICVQQHMNMNMNMIRSMGMDAGMNSTPPGTCSSIVSKAVRSRDTYSSICVQQHMNMKMNLSMDMDAWMDSCSQLHREKE
jgi:hypothetical protein